MRLIVAFLLLLAACGRPEPSALPVNRLEASADQPCRQRVFEGTRFTVCSDPQARIEVHTSGADGRPYRRFAELEQALGKRAPEVRFAMNAGMFDTEGDAIGLLVERGETLHPINLRKGGGNFHLLPNGVFLVRSDGSAEVVSSKDFKSSSRIRFATQSGPMLVIDGKLHPALDHDGTSRFVRNGVGIGAQGAPLFVISEEPVSFGKLARLFRDALGCRNALYFDGSVSSLWDPSNHRMDSFSPLGPVVVAFRAAE